MLRNLFAALMMLGIFLVAPTVNAAVETYTGTGEYTMSNFETPDIAQKRAQAYAERNAQEQAGFFIRSQSRLENFKLTQDEIITMTAGIIKILNVDIEPFIIDKHTLKFVATVVVNIDTAEIDRWLEKEAQERFELVEQNKELRRKLEEQEREIAQLKAQLKTATSDQERSELEQKFRQADEEFTAIQKLEKGNKLRELKKYREAIAGYDDAINFDPTLAAAYNNRGLCYNNLREYNRAIADFNKAIELDPKYAAAYSNRGWAHIDLERYDLAMADLNEALKLNSKCAPAYYNRGLVYLRLNEYERALADYNKTLEYDPNSSAAYNNRGWAYYNLKKYSRAIADYTKAIELNPSFTLAYNNRGNAYKALGEEAKAQADFDKANALSNQ